MPSARGGWAGVPLDVRTSERRARLVSAAIELIGRDEEVTVRSASRESGLNPRYFYANFAGPDDLLGAAYDEVAAELATEVITAVDGAGADRGDRLRAGVRQVLGFSSVNPHRGRILFTGARDSSTLVARRRHAQALLMRAFLAEENAARPQARGLVTSTRAALFAGAMTELAEQWLSGGLGDDLDAVVDVALGPALALIEMQPSGAAVR